MQLPKITYYVDDDILFELQFLEDVVFIHCVYTRYTPSIARKSKRLFEAFVNEYQGLGYKVSTISPNPKFCKLFGATSVQELVYEGNIYEVLMWESK